MKASLLVLLCALPLFGQALSINGIVTKRGSADPLSKATVELRSADGAVLDTMTTEDDGLFAFPTVRPGNYRIAARRAGYVSTAQAVSVAAGAQAGAIQVPMTATGAIYGTIVDGNGAPAGNTLVQAMKASFPQGQRVLTPVQAVRTNDLGEFRLFWLAPGRYYVAAVPRAGEPLPTSMLAAGNFGMTQINATNTFIYMSTGSDDPAVQNAFMAGQNELSPVRFVPVYFPGTPEEAAATAIDVRAGAEFGGVNFAVAPVRERRVRGIVINGATGQPARYASVTLAGAEQSRRPREAPVMNGETGAFEIALLPGTSILQAASEGATGHAVVRVGDTDLDNVNIVTTPTFDIAGKITADDPSVTPADLSKLHIRLVQDPPLVRRDLPAYAPYSTSLPDGSLTLGASAGNFRVNIAPLLIISASEFPVTAAPSLRNAYVKSIRLGGQDVLNAGLRLDKRPDDKLEIVIGSRAGSVEGIGPADAVIVLMPDNRSRTELFKSAVADPSGRFRLEHVAPGSYRVFAFPGEVEEGAWFDAEFVRGVENRGTAIVVGEGRNVTVRVE